MLRFIPLNVIWRLTYEIGTGKALANARRERDDMARTLAGIQAFEARFAAVHAAQRQIAA